MLLDSFKKTLQLHHDLSDFKTVKMESDDTKEDPNPPKKRKIEDNPIFVGFIDKFFTSQGLYYVTEILLSHLNPKDLANCRLVAQHWKNFIDNNKVWWKVQIEFIRKRNRKIERKYPGWKCTFEHFIYKATTKRLVEFTKFMWMYFKEDNKGFGSPLHFAVSKDLLAFVELLISSPTDFNAKTSDGCAPIHYVISTEMKELFVKYKDLKNIDLKVYSSRDWRIFLYDLIRLGKSELVGFMLEKGHEFGIKIDCKDSYHRNIIHVACRYGNLRMLQNIFEKPDEYAELFNAPDIEGQTPLHLACEHGHHEIVKLFYIEAFNSEPNIISERIKSSIQMMDKYGSTPKTLGADHPKVAEVFLWLTPCNMYILYKIFDRSEIKSNTMERLVIGLKTIRYQMSILKNSRDLQELQFP